MIKNLFKVFSATILFAVLLTTAVHANIQVHLNGEPVEINPSPIIIEGRTLVPARAIVEMLGGDVDWDEETRTVSVIQDDINISLTIDSTLAIVDGQFVELDVPAQIIDGSTIIPLRFVVENLGVEVQFADNIVSIVTASTDLSDFSFEQILERYTIMLREQAPIIVSEFREAAVGVADIHELAELSIEFTTILAEISVAGVGEMADLWIVQGVGNEDIYMHYAERLAEVYLIEALAISDLYLELVMELFI